MTSKLNRTLGQVPTCGSDVLLLAVTKPGMLFESTLTTESIVASICRSACMRDSSSWTETSASGLLVVLQKHKLRRPVGML